ncbi:MAG: hypothetical protein E3J72_17440 [Planctomycetota bacterium]|nr:MAG: hypothetical protein E3J72_17440 [Planctomycetota bacterium]
MKRRFGLIYIAVCIAALTAVSIAGCSKDKKKLILPPATTTGTGTGTGTSTGTNPMDLDVGEVVFTRRNASPRVRYYTVDFMDLLDDFSCTYDRKDFPNPSGEPPQAGTVTEQEYYNVIDLIRTADFFNLEPSYSCGGIGGNVVTCTVTCKLQNFGDGVDMGSVTAVLGAEPEAPQALLDLIAYLGGLLDAKLGP